MKDANRIKDVNGQFEDAYVITPAKRFFRRFANWLILPAVVAVLAGGWAAQHFYLKPRADEALVSQALRSFQESAKGEGQAKAIKRYFEQQAKRSATDQMMGNYELLGSQDFGSTDKKTIEGYLASLRVAMRAGIPEAKLEYGIALRDGLTGQKDSAAAVKVFDMVAREVDAGVRAGDPVAMYVQAQILEKGLGKEPDIAKARELAQRAVTGLDGWRLETVARPWRSELLKGISPELLKQVAERLIAQNLEYGLKLGRKYCGEAFPRNTADSVVARLRASQSRSRCETDFYKRGIDAGIESAYNGYATELLYAGESLQNVEQWYAKGVASSSINDRFAHAVIKATLSIDDLSLMGALSVAYKQIQSGEVDVALSVGHFERSIKKESPQRLEHFSIAANVSGILTDSIKNVHDDLRIYFGDQPTLLARAFSADVMRKSRIAARALIDNVPLTSVKLNSQATIAKNFWENDRLVGSPELSAKEKTVAGSAATSAQKKAAAIEPNIKDREQQDKTGYLKGQPQTAQGGLSSFTVDNRQGDRDAVARLYLNGEKPAVRHMYIKSGETFKAQNIAPGNYVFRYRFIGSEDTFESNDGFQLTQTKTETGTRYSNVTVTLFKVQNGNMTTRKVTPDKF
jgi:TPR repeat protein